MKILLSLALLFSVNAFAHQHEQAPLVFAEGALEAHLSWIQGPRTPDVSEMKIEWKSGVDKAPIEPPGPVKVVLWMPMHGHGSSPTAIEKLGQEVGVYKVSNMYFTMGGSWEVRVNLKYSNGREETLALPVEIKGGGHH